VHPKLFVNVVYFILYYFILVFSKVSCFSRDGNFFVTGGFSKTVTVWRTWDMQQLHKFPACDSSVRTLTLSDDCR
jgi:WD40 repeat protein